MTEKSKVGGLLQVACCIYFILCAVSAWATNYYVQPNGGPRYSTTYNNTGDSCNGTSNANMVVAGGPNQTCAFSDVRYLWADGSAAGLWVLASGDTAIISNTYPSGQTGWRIGNTNNTGGAFNGYSGYPSGSGSGYGPPIPSGTSAAHTRFLGANYAACSTTSMIGNRVWQVPDPTKTTQLFGGFDAWGVLNMRGSQYVDVQCIEVTDHNSCINYGAAGLPSQCSSSMPYSDFTANGIILTNQSSNILFQDVNVHGLPSSGVYGAIGGPFTLTRFRSAFNGFAGWNMDDGTGDWNGAGITASYATMEWNGCNEEYPIVDPIPATYCYSQSTGGFGDGFSGQNAYMSYFHGDHLLLRNNIKDPFFGPHTTINDIKVSYSIAYSNGGQTWKWNSGYGGTVLLQNNVTLNNCYRMKAPIAGAPSTYNTYFSDSCRADGAAMSFIMPISGTFEMDGNTFATASTNTSIDVTCWNLITGLSRAAGGSGYQVGDVILIDGGSTATVTSVDGSGSITGETFNTNGSTVAGSGSVPYTVSGYLAGGHGTGAQYTITSLTPGNCATGPRILRDNLFIGFTDTVNPYWNSSLIALFCYSSCAGSSGVFDDTSWTVRSNNLMYGYKTGTGQCSYANESCSDPQLVNEPNTTVTAEAQLDNFNFTLGASSPAIGTGIAVSSLTDDFLNNTRQSPPSMGALESGSHYSLPNGGLITGSGSFWNGFFTGFVR